MNKNNQLGADKVKIIRDILSPFVQKIDRVGLFGSYATGAARENSDIDIVIYGTLSQPDVDRIWTLFEDSALSVPVDVIAYNLPLYPPLKRHIDRVMVPLFEKESLLFAKATAHYVA